MGLALGYLLPRSGRAVDESEEARLDRPRRAAAKGNEQAEKQLALIDAGNPPP